MPEPEAMKTRERKSFRTEREFGLIVGSVFVALGSWWIYRSKFVNGAHVLLALGAVLIVFGLIWPRALVLPNKAWMLLAEGLSFVMTRVILGLVFYLVVTPIGIAKRLRGWDPLDRRSGSRESYWKPYPERQLNPRHYEKMY